MNPLLEMEIPSDERAEINLSPLIDMVFLLLIFFMVTSVFVEETGIEVKKPRAASVESLEKTSVLIAVTPDGRVIYGGREIGVNGVRGLVSRMLRDRDVPVILLADEEARAGVLVDVIDECKLAGARNVSIGATRE